MPWLGDGTWVEDARLARSIMQGRTNYRPWSHDLDTATPREKKHGEEERSSHGQCDGQGRDAV